MVEIAITCKMSWQGCFRIHDSCLGSSGPFSSTWLQLMPTQCRQEWQIWDRSTRLLTAGKCCNTCRPHKVCEYTGLLTTSQKIRDAPCGSKHFERHTLPSYSRRSTKATVAAG